MAASNPTGAPAVPITPTHPLFPFVATQLAGDLLRLVEVGAGLVTATTTPGCDRGTHEVVAWRPAIDGMDGMDAQFTSIYTLQSADGIDATVCELTGTLTAELDARAALASAVRTALGMPAFAPRMEVGETETRISVWSVRELQDVFARVGGTVTARQVERPFSCGTFATTEVAITVDLPGLGEVEVFTDWDPADEQYATSLSVIRAAAEVSA